MSEKDETVNETSDEVNEDIDSDLTNEDKDGSEDLGDKGKKALDAMKAKNKEAKARIKALEAELAESKSKSEGSKDDKEDIEKLKARLKAEYAAESLKDRALDKLEAKAAKLFTDPEDVRVLLARDVDDFIDGDRVDLEAIKDALEDLLSRKPYLAIQDESRFQGSADGGARGKSKPTQLTLADVKKLAAEGKNAEIVKAEKEGRLSDLYSK